MGAPPTARAPGAADHDKEQREYGRRGQLGQTWDQKSNKHGFENEPHLRCGPQLSLELKLALRASGRNDGISKSLKLVGRQPRNSVEQSAMDQSGVMLFEIRAGPKSPVAYFTSVSPGSHRIHGTGPSRDHRRQRARERLHGHSFPADSISRLNSGSNEKMEPNQSGQQQTPQQRPEGETKKGKEENGERSVRASELPRSSPPRRSFPRTGPEAEPFGERQEQEFRTTKV